MPNLSRSSGRSLAWLISMVVISATCSLTNCKQRTQTTAFSVANGTGAELTDVTIQLGENPVYDLPDLLPSNHFGFDGRVRLENKNTVAITWSTIDGKQNSKTFSISAKELTDEREIQFKILPDGSVSKKWRFP